MFVTVIGTGYVGTVTGACLAYLGNDVTCVDCDAAKIEKLAAGADALVIVTEWQEFRTLDLSQLAQTMCSPVLVDARNVFSPQEAAGAGLIYSGVGRGLLPCSNHEVAHRA